VSGDQSERGPLPEGPPTGVARDPGLQPERTALAWQRTGVSISGVGAAVVLVAARSGQLWLVLVTAVLATLSSACSVAAAMGGSRIARTPDGGGRSSLARAGSPSLRLVATAVATALVAVSGILVSLA